ncbi:MULTISPECIES: N-methyl-L-tryptophan oxidase [unclassified Peribacillus]|uniref:N-methyl-L-tryptophan oxidase n=1 Tax=unclassified Peribacillus TaxID=2675266 RepID=UPI001F4ED105|nr:MULTISPECIES: N-methyl-L-tryptophan oxidase [unclassified Peribacillus]MCK1985985.1 N-methyl-L-tryptophan oxidase [Peribacillus sp. Aquil_B1]MCK2011208.1 N-methyl-L-tryptophan oxidase [Peribacillus sp. Aquil_B8]
MNYEVGVIGLGVIGSMTLWQLARQGVSVVGFEQYGIGHDRSAAGGESRLFRTAYKEGPQYVPMLKESKKLWIELEKETNKQLLLLNGGLTIGHPDAEFMQNVLKSVNDFDIDHEILDHKTATEKYPQHILLEDEIIIFDKEAGVLKPEHAVLAAAKRAEALGSSVHSYTKVLDIKEVSDGVEIRTENGTFKVGQLIVTAGPWLTDLLPQFKREVKAKKIILSWFAAEDIGKFEPDCFPVFTRRNNTHKFFGTPSIDHSMVKVGTSLPVCEVPDPNLLNRTVEIEELKDTLEIVRTYLQGLHPDPIRVAAYMDAYSSDDHSVIGKLPGSEFITVAGGFSGHGFKMGPVVGKIAGEIALNQEISFPVHSFAPARLLQKVEK